MPPKADHDPQALPKAELKEFLQVQKLYDKRNFKRALKAADGILAKFPEHGETLSMKGLLLNQLNRKEEAHEFCKAGLKHNLRSPTCWHVYGLVYKSERNYLEACKCFKNAIRMDDPGSPNLGMILRDLSQMQLQLRDVAGFVDSRAKWLKIGTNFQFASGWVSLALGHHLAKNYEEAVAMLRRLRSFKLENSKLSRAQREYERSELYLYEAFIYKDGGMYDKALAVLDTATEEKAIRDVNGALEMRAELLALLGRKEEAKDIYYKLLDVNTENHRYHDRLIEMVEADSDGDASGGSPADGAVVDKLEAMYVELAAKYPKSRLCKRIPLDFDLPNDRFKERLRSFVMPYLERGIPSLSAELAPLYADARKGEMIGETLLEIRKFRSGCSDENDKEVLFWVDVCLAMHYSTVGMDTEAISTIDRAIIEVGGSDPVQSRIDAFSAKSKILETAGDYLGAADMAEEARKLDLADRYLNCQASMALFKALRVEEAEDVCHLFTTGGNNNFYDMQATWYEMASGQAYSELKDYGRALKRFKKVEEHYVDFIDDQYDFFAYCTHKQTMRSYVEMLRSMDSLVLGDSLHSSRTLAAAVEAAVRIYIHLSNHPFKTETELLEEQVANMPPEEADAARRELREKLERQEDRERQREEQQKPADSKGNEGSGDGGGGGSDGGGDTKANGNSSKSSKGKNSGNSNGNKKDEGDGEGEEAKKVDLDPKGITLAKTGDPLDDAKKMVDLLLSGAPDELTTHLLAYGVDVRLAAGAPSSLSLPLKHVRSAVRVSGASHPRVHECIVDLALRAASGTDDKAPEVAEVAALLGGKSAADYHAAWKAEAEADAEAGDNTARVVDATIVAAKLDGMLAGADGAAATAAWAACAAKLKGSPQDLRNIGHERCRGILAEFVSEKNEKATDAFREACSQAFPQSNTFGAVDLGAELSALTLK